MCQKIGKNVLTLRRSSSSALIAPIGSKRKRLTATALKGGQHEKPQQRFFHLCSLLGRNPRTSGGRELAVRNGSIANFSTVGINLGVSDCSVVEGLRVFDGE